MAEADTEPALYNVAFTDQSAYVIFLPYRDGPVDSQWNVSYSQSAQDDWSYSNNLGKGISSHNTSLVGASVELSWTGTGVWIYGTGDRAAYTVQIDSDPAVLGQGDNEGVLFTQTNLTYGPHGLTLTVLNTLISITGVNITVGLGDSGTVLQARNISGLLTGTTVVNPFFSVDETWSVVDLYANQSANYPCIATYTSGAMLSFTLNATVGFDIYGSDDWYQGLFTVTVTSSGGTSAVASVPNSTIQYSPRSGWTALNQLKYLATGLDNRETYNVQVQNLGNTFNLASVIAYDAVPRLAQSRVSSSCWPLSSVFGTGEERVMRVTIRLHHRSPEALVQPVPPLSKSELSSTLDSTALYSSSAGGDLHGPVPIVQNPDVASNMFDRVGSAFYERDGGPLIFPPRYDEAWMGSAGRAGQEGQQHASQEVHQPPTRRPLPPIPTGKGTDWSLYTFGANHDPSYEAKTSDTGGSLLELH
ncbi:predicted protein [Postia placenta Mad-698-R]|nr:predicted protein [Postia placenta Mad-698-R]